MNATRIEFVMPQGREVSYGCDAQWFRNLRIEPTEERVAMTTQTAEYARSTIISEDYEPFVVGGEAIGEVHWIRTEGAEGATLAVGLWRSEPQSFPYPFTADETIHALQGELVIDLESGEKVTLRPGDIASFTKGTKSTWTVTQPFKKLFVISG
jgi:uncharacterized cupin superfamily protein